MQDVKHTWQVKSDFPWSKSSVESKQGQQHNANQHHESCDTLYIVDGTGGPSDCLSQFKLFFKVNISSAFEQFLSKHGASHGVWTEFKIAWVLMQKPPGHLGPRLEFRAEKPH